MIIPLRKNGIFLSMLVLCLLTLIVVAEIYAINIADKPVTVIISKQVVTPLNRPEKTVESDQESEDFDLSRTREHRSLMANPELARNPEQLLEELAKLSISQGKSPALFNDMGIAALRAGDPQKAATFFIKATELLDDYARAWYNLGIAYKRSKNASKAKAAYEKALELNPHYQKAAINLAALLRSLGDLEQALALFAKAAEMSSADTRARALLQQGEVLYDLERFEESVKVIRKSIDYNPRDSLSWLALGKSLTHIPEEKQTAIAAFNNAASLSPNDIDIRLDIASPLADANLNKEALKHLQHALQINPSSQPIREEMASIFEKQGDLESAQTQYKWLADNADNKAHQARYLAELAFLDNDLNAAIEHLRAAVKESDGDDLKSWQRLGLVLSKAGETEQALAEYELLLKKHPKNVKALVAAASLALDQNLGKKAESFLQRATAQGTSNPNTWFNLGRLRESQNKPEDAAEAYQNCLRIDPDFRGAALRLAIIKRQLGEPEVAVELYQKVLSQNPRYTLARYNLGVVLSSIGRADEAAIQYALVLEQDPDNQKARLNLAVIRRSQGLYEEARDLLQTGLAQDPSNISARFNLALLYGDLELKTEQEKELKRILRLDPKFGKAWRSLGRLYEEREAYIDASQAYQQPLESEPEHTAPLLYSLGVKVSQQGDDLLAKAIYQSLLETVPDLTKAAINLALLENKSGNYEIAIDLLDKIIKKYPDNTAAMFNLAMILENSGKTEQAIEKLERLVEIKPEHKGAWRLLGKWHQVAGNLKKAKLAMEKVLELDPEDQVTREQLNTLTVSSGENQKN